MRSMKVWHIFTAFVAFYATPFSANAQQDSGNAPQPPQLEKLEEGEPPAVTIRGPERQSSVVEKRERGGRVTEVQVTSGNSTYYLRPNTQAGSAIPGDGESNTMRAAQWRIGEFDLRRSDDERKAAAARAVDPAPPPPIEPTQPAAPNK